MNLSRYDDLLTKRNNTPGVTEPLTKLREECLELALAIEHYQQGRAASGKIIEELADVLLTGRGAILSEGEDFLEQLNSQLESKAKWLLKWLLDRKYCYQCNKVVTWLAPDGRCSECTRLTLEEVVGENYNRCSSKINHR